MSLELARRLGKEAALHKKAILGMETASNIRGQLWNALPRWGTGPTAAPSVPSPNQPKFTPTVTSVNVRPQQPGNFGGLWNAFQTHMQNPALLGTFLGNPAMAPMTKGILGMTGPMGLFGMTDLLGRGGKNIQTLTSGAFGSQPQA